MREFNPAEKVAVAFGLNDGELVISGGINSKRKPLIIMCSTVQSGLVMAPFGPFSPIAGIALTAVWLIVIASIIKLIYVVVQTLMPALPATPHHCIKLTHTF